MGSASLDSFRGGELVGSLGHERRRGVLLREDHKEDDGCEVMSSEGRPCLRSFRRFELGRHEERRTTTRTTCSEDVDLVETRLGAAHRVDVRECSVHEARRHSDVCERTYSHHGCMRSV